MTSFRSSLVRHTDDLWDFLRFVALDVEEGIDSVDLADIMYLHYVLKVILQFFMSVALGLEVNPFRQGDHLIGDLDIVHPSLKLLL